MLSDRVEVQWQRRRGIRKIHIVAALGALVAVVCVLSVFTGLGRALRSAKPEPQLIGTIDLRLGNTILAAERGETQARADIEAGLLQLQSFTPEAQQTRAEAAKARQMKQRYGVTWVHKSGEPTPVSQAFVDGYNRVVRAEIERRFGKEAADLLKPREDAGVPPP